MLRIPHREKLARLPTFVHVLVRARSTDSIESRESQRNIINILDMREQICKRERILNSLSSPLALERTRGVSSVAHNTDRAAVIFGDVG